MYYLLYEELNEEKAIGSDRVNGEWPKELYDVQIFKDKTGKVMFFNSKKEAEIQIKSNKIDEKAFDYPETRAWQVIHQDDIIFI